MLAQSPFERLGSEFRESAGEASIGPYIVLTVIPIVTAVGIAATYQYIQHRRVSIDSPERLFRDLCRAHDLRWHEERALRKMARAANLDDPSELMVIPERFASAVAAAAHKMSGSDSAVAEDLRERLFSCYRATAPKDATSSSCPSLRSLPS